MGFKKGLTTADGTEYKNAYFKIHEVHYDLAARRCEFRLLVYKDKDARDSGKAKLKGVPGITNFSIREEDFDTYFADSVLKEAGKSLMTQCYAYLKKHKDYESATDVDPDK